jgi:hypothetical protein
MSFETSALLVTWVAIVLMAFVVAGLVRQVYALTTGRVRVRASEVGLSPGTSAPEFARLAAGHSGRLLLLFLSEGCGICDEVLDEVARVAGKPSRSSIGLRILYATTPSLKSVREGGNGVSLLRGETKLFDEYEVPATPFAVTIDAAGHIVHSEPIGSRDAFRRLMEQATADSAPEAAIQPSVNT